MVLVEVIPDVIVAPSHFAVTHPSVEAALEVGGCNGVWAYVTDLLGVFGYDVIII